MWCLGAGIEYISGINDKSKLYGVGGVFLIIIYIAIEYIVKMC